MNNNKRISFKTILVTLIILYLGLSLISYFLFSSHLYDGITLLLVIGIGLILILSVKFSRKFLFDQFAILTLFFLIFAFPRILMYLFAPDAVIFPFGDDIDANTINAGLLYVLIGTLLYVIGMVVADIVFRPRRSQASPTSGDSFFHAPRNLVILFLMIVAIQLYSTMALGLSSYGKMQAESSNTWIQLIKTLLELDSAFLFVFATLLLQDKSGNRSQRKALLLVFVAYVLMTVLSGSRVGVLRAFMAIVIILIIIEGNFSLKLSSLLRTIIILGGLSLILYPLATMSRLITSSSYRNSSDAYSFALDETEGLKTKAGLLTSALNRLGVIDYAILITTQKGDTQEIEKYMNFSYVTKNIINMIVPGTPFPEAEIMTSRVVDVIYRGAAEPAMYEQYFSEYWTQWGLMYVYFGWFGGLLALFVTGIIFQSIYSIIILTFSGFYQFYLRLWFLTFVTSGFIANMGFDSAFTALFNGLLQFATLFLCLKFGKIFSTHKFAHD